MASHHAAASPRRVRRRLAVATVAVVVRLALPVRCAGGDDAASAAEDARQGSVAEDATAPVPGTAPGVETDAPVAATDGPSAQDAQPLAEEQASAEVAADETAAAEAARLAAEQAAAAEAQRVATEQAAAAEAARLATEQAAAAEAARLAEQDASTDPRFGSCREALASGFGMYVAGVDAEYDWYDDGDSDGVVCEPPR